MDRLIINNNQQIKLFITNFVKIITEKINKSLNLEFKQRNNIKLDTIGLWKSSLFLYLEIFAQIQDNLI